MFKLLLVIVTIAQASAYEPGFKIKWGLLLGAGSTFNYPIATNISGAKSDGWVTVSRRSDAFFPDLVMYCPEDDNTFCSLYDITTEYVAGFQVAIAVENFTDSFPSDLTTVGFNNWALTKDNTTVNYLIQEQFFVDQAYLDKTVSEKQALIEAATSTLLYNGGVWVPDVTGDQLLFISSDASLLEGSETLGNVQNCIPGMGLHYNNESTTVTCDVLYPWFTVSKGSELLGTGFGFYGKYTKTASRDWFDHPSYLANKITIPNSPDCFKDLVSEPGRITMHIYYVSEPTSIGCSVGEYGQLILDLF